MKTAKVKTAKLIKRQGALMLAVVLLVLTARPEAAYGATGIDVDEKGTITFDLPVSEGAPDEEGTNGQQYYKELQEHEIKVDLYRVASVDISGRYTALGAYETGGLNLADISASTTADQWLAFAEKAKEITDASGSAAPEATVTIAAGAGRATSGELETGMYLADAQEVVTGEYVYRFTPFLVALPGNNYSAANSDDAWIYDVTVGLKPDRQERYGDIAVEKTLLTYNETLGGATALFQVEAVKDGEIVYSNIIPFHFDTAGVQTYVVEKLPIGAVVTIREVYSGASYANAGSPREYTVTVDDANPKYDTPDETGGEAYAPFTVSFFNNYNEETNGGSSVVNHFTYKTAENGEQDAAPAGGTWDVEQIFSDGRGGAEQ